MTATRFRAAKGARRRPLARRLAKRRQEVLAFEAWQRHAGDNHPGKERAGEKAESGEKAAPNSWAFGLPKYSRNGLVNSTFAGNTTCRAGAA